MPNPDDLISITQGAELLGCERSTIHRWIREGRIQPAMKVAGETGVYLLRREDLEGMRGKFQPRPKQTL